MPYEELLGWHDYLEKRPAGWRDVQRAAMIMQSFGVKATPDKLFSSLAKMKASAVEVSKDGIVSIDNFKQAKRKLTIEVRNDGTIVQARGLANRGMKSDEKAIVARWAKENGLYMNNWL